MEKIIEKNKVLDEISKIMLIIVISGIFGFIYETIFYRIDLGYFIKRGITFGPWIPIYGLGGTLINFACSKVKDKTLYIFLISAILCGALELVSGYFIYEIGHIRLWDYNIEIWNFGNIGGYICLRSVLFFGVSGVILMKLVLPLIDIMKNKVNKKVFFIISFLPGILFILDVLVSNIMIFLKCNITILNM